MLVPVYNRPSRQDCPNIAFFKPRIRHIHGPVCIWVKTHTRLISPTSLPYPNFGGRFIVAPFFLFNYVLRTVDVFVLHDSMMKQNKLIEYNELHDQICFS
jgi:hypothetical protein